MSIWEQLEFLEIIQNGFQNAVIKVIEHRLVLTPKCVAKKSILVRVCSK